VPQGCSLFGVIRDGVPTPLRGDTVLAEGDKVIAIGRPDCEDELRGQLIGVPQQA
jgi:Trk K+ transport system NAD-binding subunit